MEFRLILRWLRKNSGNSEQNSGSVSLLCIARQCILKGEGRAKCYIWQKSLLTLVVGAYDNNHTMNLFGLIQVFDIEK